MINASPQLRFPAREPGALIEYFSTLGTPRASNPHWGGACHVALVAVRSLERGTFASEYQAASRKHCALAMSRSPGLVAHFGCQPRMGTQRIILEECPTRYKSHLVLEEPVDSYLKALFRICKAAGVQDELTHLRNQTAAAGAVDDRYPFRISCPFQYLAFFNRRGVLAVEASEPRLLQRLLAAFG